MAGIHRVVVTGIGVISPFGRGVEHNWSRLVAGDVAIQALGEQFAALPSRVAGLVPEGPGPCQLDLPSYFSRPELRLLSRGTCLAVLAAEDAAHHAGWRPTTDQDQISTAVCIGMGMSDLTDISTTAEEFERRGARGVSPFFAARILLNMPAGEVARRLGCRGPTLATSTACATGCHSVGDAFRLLRHGLASRAFCGSVDAAVNPLTAAAFAQMRALSRRFNTRPREASRPFDGARDGFVLAEGAAVLLLETLDAAGGRGATPLAELLGYGMTGDATHPTAPRPDGEGARRAMSLALDEAEVQAPRVGHVSAHATGTPLGDAVELQAIADVLAGGRPLVSSCKGALGHLLGGAGSVELAMAVMSCYRGLVPATANLHTPDCPSGVVPWRPGSPEESGPAVRLVMDAACPWPDDGQRRVALKNSFGFGGTNASLCLANVVE